MELSGCPGIVPVQVPEQPGRSAAPGKSLRAWLGKHESECKQQPESLRSKATLRLNIPRCLMNPELPERAMSP